MDQSVAAGVGNILRAELLYRARQSPFTPGREVEVATLRSIWKDAGVLMKAAMVDRRIVTTRPKDRPHKKGPGAEGRGALCVPAAGAALFCVRD